MRKVPLNNKEPKFLRYFFIAFDFEFGKLFSLCTVFLSVLWIIEHQNAYRTLMGENGVNINFKFNFKSIKTSFNWSSDEGFHCDCKISNIPCSSFSLSSFRSMKKKFETKKTFFLLFSI